MEIADIIVERETEGYFAYHRSALTSPEIHRAEIERIFNRSWLYVGHESEVPNRGDFVRRTVGLRPLFFVRSQTTGEVQARSLPSVTLPGADCWATARNWSNSDCSRTKASENVLTTPL